jgi:hypothetical protein
MLRKSLDACDFYLAIPTLLPKMGKNAFEKRKDWVGEKPR